MQSLLRASLSSSATAAQNVIPWLPHSEATRDEMLKTIGVKSQEELFEVIPEQIRINGVGLPPPKSEMEVENELRAIAAKSLDATKAPFFCGAGCYRHHIPAAVDHLIQRSEFMTAYTPYQPEISQGTLAALFEFQNYICRLSGMQIANATMYDGPTAAAEAALMAFRLKKGRKKIVLAGGLHPHYRDCVESYLGLSELGKVHSLRPDICGSEQAREELFASIDKKTAAVIVQNPTVFGHVEDLRPLAQACKKAGALLVVAVTDPASLGAIQSPGEMGADIVIGEAQPLATAMSFGGPTCGFFAARKQHMRQMPGRLVGETVDEAGNKCYVLTLGTREQHIRREKATSNICTSASLLATSFSMHLAMLGEVGLKNLAMLNHRNAVDLATRLREVGEVGVVNKTFFNEFTVKLPTSATEVVERMARQGVLGGVPASRLFREMPKDDTHLLVAATETNTHADMDAMVTALKKSL